MEKTCFVIMPFGSSSPELKKKFDGVYKGIIVPAVQEAGYEPIREDISATPGSIPKSIIKKLAESQMVIADLTGINPNVFYELGIRHVFSKSGTVLMINKGETIPFDNASHRVIQYTNELADLDDIHQQVTTAIINRENNIDNADNIVHDTFSQLPIDMASFFEQSMQDNRYNELQKNLSILTKENKQLRAMLASQGIIDNTANIRIQRSVKEIISEARFALQKSGKEVLIHMHQLIGNNEIDKFLDYLEDVMEAGYLTEEDYIQIHSLCESSGYLPLELAIMERAFDLFPSSNSIARTLSDVYTRMPLQETKLKGVRIIENILGVKEVDGNYILTVANTNRNIDKYNLSALFNAYVRLDLFERTISVCESCEELDLPTIMPLIIRNKAAAYGELKIIDKAQEAYETLLQMDYYDDTNHAFYASFLGDIGEYVNAYHEREIAAILDKNDPARFINLAIEILNYGYVRCDEQTITKLAMSDNEFNYAMPIFLHVIEMSNANSFRTQIIELLMRRDQSAYAEAILSGNTSGIDTSILQNFPLQYVLKSDIDSVKSIK